MKEKQKEWVIWSSDLYDDDDAKQSWWENEIDAGCVGNYNESDLAECLGIEIKDLDDEQRQALNTLIPAYTKAQNNEPDDERWYEEVNDLLDCQKNDWLNKDINGIIVCYGDIGTWNGRYQQISKVGSNISRILSPDNADFSSIKFYGDEKDIRADYAHHDATNYYLYRIIKDESVYERLRNKMDKGEMSEEYFIKNSRSLRPEVAKIYGW